MKKTIALLLSCAVMSSLILGGCTEKKETETSKTTSQTETTQSQTETSETTEKPVYDNKKLDAEKLQKALELYKEKEPEGEYYVAVFADGIPGDGSYMIDDKSIHFNYSSLSGQRVDFAIDTVKEMVYYDFGLQYGDTSYSNYTPDNTVGLSQIESFIDTLLDGHLSDYALEDSALAANKAKIEKDIPILYSRMVKLADNAFTELGFGLDELGIDWGTKYSSVDPKQRTSTEVEIKNEHKFENGVCSDCGMVWTQYFYDVLGKLSPNAEEYRYLYAQKSDSMLSPQDMIQCFANGKDYAELNYSTNTDDFRESFRATIDNSEGKPNCTINYNLEEKEISLGDGVFTCKYKYALSISANPGEFDKVFESKESLVKNSSVYLFIADDNGVGTDVLSTKSEEEIKKILEDDGCKFLTKDEFVDMFLEHYKTFFECFDKGMVWIDTTMADAGFNWK